MSLTRMYGLFLRHFYLITRSFPRVLDLVYWPTIQITLWGFISNFFATHTTYYNNAVGVILTCAILYDFLFRTSIGFNMLFLEEIWSRNFTNLFIAPMKIGEILTSLVATALIRALMFNTSSAFNLSVVWYFYFRFRNIFILFIFEPLFIWNNTWHPCVSWSIEIRTLF